MFYLFLVIAAIIPVILLCSYINAKDIHKESKGLLISIFIFGALSCIPILFVEIFLGSIFSTDDSSISLIEMLINVFIAVALVEEGFKWLVAYNKGYKSREFDEIYDIIVYSTFASLGFACIENIGYVLGGGMSVAILRALLSIPGHACFGVLMGYSMAKAKMNQINGQQSLYKRNLLLSLLIPSLFHAIYDAVLLVDMDTSMKLIIFFAFDIAMVIYCFTIVKKMSKVQQIVTNNINQGYIVQGNMGTINYVNPYMNNNNNMYNNGMYNQNPNMMNNTMYNNTTNNNMLNQNMVYNNTMNNNMYNQNMNNNVNPNMIYPNYNCCPICGYKNEGLNNCRYCGFRYK